MIVLDIISWIFLLSGAFFSIVGAFGIVRLPEFYSRLHAGGVTDTMGVALIMLGLIFQSGHIWLEHGAIAACLVAGKLLIILFFLLVTSPSSCHALAKSALLTGLEPQIDPPPKQKPVEKK